MDEGIPRANLDLTVDNKVLARARQRALDEGTTLEELVRDYLGRYVEWRDQVEATRAFIALAATSGGRSTGPWTREELHERKDGGDSST